MHQYIEYGFLYKGVEAAHMDLDTILNRATQQNKVKVAIAAARRLRGIGSGFI
ncbi:hypothetical protein HV436_00900 [Bacillus sporothermodurans]|nr:hypothetical protein [Heyndrickxia sporothermodurans]MBL5809262.1 hypothetical protein [Heyndrickxia sporothermodurans]MBL5829890.1 hypothetical protein [Heyndrickxia sporothermodurans]MBL5844884.1 hypothetical protein [Heyndrickxia sporothermodurans]MBL5848453.1 hypothetical protein [Heyndrickxia sporothermodurans]MBL5864560.1 hypothetical protein [Heyndrickxia sporothermodurans]